MGVFCQNCPFNGSQLYTYSLTKGFNFLVFKFNDYLSKIANPYFMNELVASGSLEIEYSLSN